MNAIGAPPDLFAASLIALIPHECALGKPLFHRYTEETPLECQRAIIRSFFEAMAAWRLHEPAQGSPAAGEPDAAGAP